MGAINVPTDAEIAALRQAVLAGLHTVWHGPCQIALCADGPLSGIRVRIRPDDFKPADAVFGWSTVVAGGAIVAQYVHGQKTDTLRFRGWHQPGRTEGGAK